MRNQLHKSHSVEQAHSCEQNKAINLMHLEIQGFHIWQERSGRRNLYLQFRRRQGHGTQNFIRFGDDNMYSPIMAISDVSIGGMRIFSDSELVVYCCCLCGSGGKTANNLVVATYKEGAKNVIGFTVEINCGEANDWLSDFFDSLVLKGQIDHSTICQVLSEIGATYAGTTVSNSNILYMYN